MVQLDVVQLMTEQPRMIFHQDTTLPTLPTLAEAQAIRDRVVPAIAQKATQRDASFSLAAGAVILQHLRDHERASGEELTLACKCAGILPHDDRAFGAVYALLLRRGLIERAGSVQRVRGHGCAGGNLFILTAAGRSEK